MRRRVFKRSHTQSHEFELDLAPLLSVMVKLVPVLLLSSAFVQVMTVDGELPNAIQQAVEQSEKQSVQIKLLTDAKKNLKLLVVSPAGTETTEVKSTDGQLPLDALHQALVETKRKNPQVFHLLIHPSQNISYQEVIQMMDEARKAKSAGVEFPFQDPEKGEVQQTQWMFPEVMIDPTEAS